MFAFIIFNRSNQIILLHCNGARMNNHLMKCAEEYQQNVQKYKKMSFSDETTDEQLQISIQNGHHLAPQKRHIAPSSTSSSVGASEDDSNLDRAALSYYFLPMIIMYYSITEMSNNTDQL